MKLVTLLLCLSLLVLIGACTKAANTNKSTSTNSTNASASPKSTEAAKSPSGSSVSTRVSTPEAAANGLLEAWETKDESAAATYATEAAFRKLFTEGGGPEGMQSQGCGEEEGMYNCAYTYEGGALIMYVKGSETSGYKVQSIEFIAD